MTTSTVNPEILDIFCSETEPLTEALFKELEAEGVISLEFFNQAKSLGLEFNRKRGSFISPVEINLP
jgi:phosphoribosylaminoimidazole carboxylase (NCAIR synthetase)